jgi:hypothetical protein
LWSVPVANVNVGGPALGDDGVLAICGIASTVRTYRCAGFFQPYGAGCEGSGGFVPALAGSGCPAGGETITLTVSGGLGGAAGILFLGLGTGSQPLQGCELQVLPVLPVSIPLLLGGAGPGNGGVALPAGIPPGVPVVDLYLQALFADSGAPGGVSGTAPLRLHIE